MSDNNTKWLVNCAIMSNIVRKSRNYDDEYHMVKEKVFDVTKWGSRHGQCFLLFLTLTIAYSMRSCIGVALVAMTQNINVHGNANNNANLTVGRNVTEGNFADDFEFKGIFNALLLTPPYPKFQWTKKTQDMVISAFFWGYMVLQIPAGQLAYKFGARYLLFGALMTNCVISLILPAITYYGGWIFALICRIGQGLSQACIIPSIHTVLGQWSPLEERGRMSGIIYGGQSLGTVLGLPLTGFIASSPLGWPGIFRFYGILSGVIAVFLWFLLADSPAQHSSISIYERKYIEEALGQKKGEKLPVPWKRILTHPGMIAIIFAHIGNTWSQVFLYSQVPAYMDKVMGVNIKANGLLSALPFMMMFFANFFFSWLSDMIIVKKYLTVTNTRKLANTIGYVPAAIGFIALGYAPMNIYVIESILIAICCFSIAAHLGFYINHIDISPNFAGVMMSISNFIANTVGSFAPLAAGLILTDATNVYLWRKVFFIAGGLYFFTNLVYVVLGTAELAHWNDPTQHETILAQNESLLVELEKENSKDVYEDLDENHMTTFIEKRNDNSKVHKNTNDL